MPRSLHALRSTSGRATHLVWNALVALQKQNDHLHLVLSSLRYRFADRIHALLRWRPLKHGIRWLLGSGERVLRWFEPRR